MNNYIFHIVSGSHSPNRGINERIDIILKYCKNIESKGAEIHIVVAPEYFLSIKPQSPKNFTSVEDYRAIKNRFLAADLPDNVILIPGTATRQKSLQSKYDNLFAKFKQAKDHEKGSFEKNLQIEHNRIASKGKLNPNSIKEGYKYEAFKTAYKELKGATYKCSASSLKITNNKHEYLKKNQYELENGNSYPHLTMNSLLIIQASKKLGTYNKMTNYNEHEFEEGFCYFPGGSNPYAPFQNRGYKIGELNCSFEICYDHNRKIRKTIIDDARFQTKPLQVHFILSDSVTTNTQTYISDIIFHSSTNTAESGAYIWLDGEYHKVKSSLKSESLGDYQVLRYTGEWIEKLLKMDLITATNHFEAPLLKNNSFSNFLVDDEFQFLNSGGMPIEKKSSFLDDDTNLNERKVSFLEPDMFLLKDQDKQLAHRDYTLSPDMVKSFSLKTEKFQMKGQEPLKSGNHPQQGSHNKNQFNYDQFVGFSSQGFQLGKVSSLPRNQSPYYSPIFKSFSHESKAQFTLHPCQNSNSGVGTQFQLPNQQDINLIGQPATPERGRMKYGYQHQLQTIEKQTKSHQRSRSREDKIQRVKRHGDKD